MRDLSEITSERHRLAALKGGWRCISTPFMDPDGTGPHLWWRGPGRRLYRALETEVLRSPLREQVRADQICHFTGECFLCGERAELAAGGVVLEHLPGCQARPELIFRAAAVAAN
jgi:hypothetical protein